MPRQFAEGKSVAKMPQLDPNTVKNHQRLLRGCCNVGVHSPKPRPFVRTVCVAIDASRSFSMRFGSSRPNKGKT